MRYWVAGATGFLGRHLVSQLAQRGEQLVACSRRGGELEGTPIQALDVLDAEAVAASAQGCDCALIAVGAVSQDPGDAQALHRVHVQGTQTAMAGLARAGVSRVVYASTSGTIAISDHDTVFDETAPTPMRFAARWPYYRSKVYAEQEALKANKPGFSVSTVNPSLLLGPGDYAASSTGDIKLFLEQRIAAIPRGGLSFVDVRDVASTMIDCATRGRAGERYLLTAKNLSVAAFFERLERLTGVPAPKLKLPAGRALVNEGVRWVNRVTKSWGGSPALDEVRVDMAQHYWYCTADKAIEELGFAPRDPAQTLLDTVQDLVARQAAFPRQGHFATSTGASTRTAFSPS